MKIMDIGFNALNNIGSNYYVKLNEKEVLIYEDVEEKGSKTPQEKKLEKDEEKKAEQKAKESSSDELSEDEERLVRDLQSRDSEVRSHEAAHQAAGGGMTGAASYSYQQGPDGKMYAIGGEVSISMKGGSTPQETIANARQVAAAAMAPGNPSPQDYSVAASARVMEMKAQQQLAREQQEEVMGKETYKSQAVDSSADSKAIDNKDLKLPQYS